MHLEAGEQAREAFFRFVSPYLSKRELAQILSIERTQKNKRELLGECLEHYGSTGMLSKTRFLKRWLNWEKKLILKPLLDRPLKIQELLKHYFIHKTIKGGMPEIAFGQITNGVLSQTEVEQRLRRRIRTLRKRGVLLLDNEGKYLINPMLREYLSLVLAGETPPHIRNEAMRYASTLRKEYRHWLVPVESVDPRRIARKYDEFLNTARKAKSDLRFGVPFVKASDLARQFYCEKWVELVYQYERPVTEAMEAGKKAHEGLLEGIRKVSEEQVLQDIVSGIPVFVHEMPLCAFFKDIPILGFADAVFFDGARPVFLFEFKFTRVPIPFAYHHVQAQLCCLLLRELGFDTSALHYVLVLAPPGSNREFMRLVCAKVVHATALEPRTQILSANVIVRKFDHKKSKQNLAWAIDFWLNKREAKPTSKREKCARCDFRTKCSTALVK
jgi:hypothetical protein